MAWGKGLERTLKETYRRTEKDKDKEGGSEEEGRFYIEKEKDGFIEGQLKVLINLDRRKRKRSLCFYKKKQKTALQIISSKICRKLYPCTPFCRFLQKSAKT